MTNQYGQNHAVDMAPHKAGWWPIIISLWLLLTVTLSGCGGGSGGGGDSVGSSESGELVLALTDAEGDFLTYLVDITSIKLVHQNGSVVEALPLSTTVDFAQYVELSELLTIATVPAGLYQSVELNIDYSNASVLVQADDGSALTASLVDGDGNALNQLTVTIDLVGSSRFRIAPGIPAQVTLDLDLEASNSVQIDNGEAVVMVEPVLLADAIFENPKPFRLRGLLDTVAVEESVFAIDLLPFRHRQRGFGSARIHVDADTRYEINGEVFDADNGLQQLAQLAEDTPVVSGGEWSRERRAFIANTVYAGSSVPWNDKDVLRGVVTARVENTLTVRGALIELASGDRGYYEQLTVELGPDTTVTQQLAGIGNADIADISVGSLLTVSGVLQDDLTVDASAGHVRISLGNLTGSVVSVSPMSVDLQRLSGRNVSIYDFTGTGTDAASDADPNHYEIDTSRLQLGSLAMGEPVKVRGLVAAFGSAPEDFDAQTVLDASDVKGHMLIAYNRQGVSTALAQLSEDGLRFDLADAEGRSLIVRAGIITQLAALPVVPLVVPAADQGIYALTRRGRIEIFKNFDDFVLALDEALAAGDRVTRFDGHGHYDATGGLFSSSRLRIGLTQ